MATVAATSTGSFVDVLLIGVVVLAMWIGWKQGAVAASLAILGVIAGGVLGLELAPHAMKSVAGSLPKLMAGLALVLILVVIGHSVGSVAGQSIRNNLRSPTARGVDSGFGAVVQTIAALLVTWLVAVPMATVVPGFVGEQIRESRGLNIVDALAPDSMNGLVSDILRSLNQNGMPVISPSFGDQPQMEDVPADPSVVSQDVVDAVRPSIVRIMGEAPQCQRLFQGTGFVVDEDTIVTNAHVVAGAETIRLETVMGVVDADVVHFDPVDDVAILHSYQLGLPAVEWADAPASDGDGAVVLGFPESGPFKAIPARVETTLTIRGSDIYSQGRHDRQSYVLRADVRHGNSGGPLMTPEGKVFGLIFGAGLNSEETGYALTAVETREHIEQAKDLTTPVDTEECVEQ
ncbi:MULTISPECIES: MarP family serine protease [unclassified Corynebacterium]|uniref:MarP family serine protease n=1 Tax=unclassified Corynebacterium TaxID=2624378 RepID=UPI00309AF370